MTIFSEFDGKKRLAVVLSVAWFFIGGTVYILSLGTYTSGPTYVDKLPAIVNFWESICSQLGLPVFNVEIPPGQDLMRDYLFYQTFHILGFILFIAIPSTFLVLAVYAFDWVRTGFVKENDSL